MTKIVDTGLTFFPTFYGAPSTWTAREIKRYIYPHDRRVTVKSIQAELDWLKSPDAKRAAARNRRIMARQKRLTKKQRRESMDNLFGRPTYSCKLPKNLPPPKTIFLP